MRSAAAELDRNSFISAIQMIANAEIILKKERLTFGWIMLLVQPMMTMMMTKVSKQVHMCHADTQSLM